MLRSPSININIKDFNYIKDIIDRTEDTIYLSDVYMEASTIPYWNEYRHKAIYLANTLNHTCDGWYLYDDGFNEYRDDIAHKIFDLHLNGVMIHISYNGHIDDLYGNITSNTHIGYVVLWYKKKKHN